MAQFIELDIDQGTSFNIILDLTKNDGSAMNITAYTITSSIRKSYYSSSYINLTAEIPDAANGKISLKLLASQTANIKAGRYLFDVKAVSPDATPITTRLVEGIVTVNPQVTQ
jgi:hypothetical protein